ncbi:unnamed protein product [Boreogadus saida]
MNVSFFPGPSPPVLPWVILVYTAVIHLCVPGPRLAAIAELLLPPPDSIILTYSQLLARTPHASHSPGHLYAPSHPYHVISSQLLPDLSTAHQAGTDEDTRQFIAWRAANTMLFTGVKKSAKDGFEQCIKDKGLGGKISTQQVKRKWENLTAKYKDLRKPQSGVGTEDGKATAASWKWYMDGILGQKPSISPPVVISSSGQGAAVATPSSVPCTSADDTITSPPNKRHSSVDEKLGVAVFGSV